MSLMLLVVLELVEYTVGKCQGAVVDDVPKNQSSGDGKTGCDWYLKSVACELQDTDGIRRFRMVVDTTK